MKKRLLVILSLAIVVSLAIVMLPGSETEAMGCMRCLPGGSTPPAWGHGATCQAAISDAQGNAAALIPGSCDTCEIEFEFLEPCIDACDDPDNCFNLPGHANQWQVDAKAIYRCLEDFCIP